GLDERDRRVVIDRIGVHRLDDGDVVDDFCRVRQQLADPGACLTVLRELVDRLRHRQRRLPHGLGDALALADGVGNLRALEFFESRLVVARLELRRSPGLMQEEYALGARSVMRKPDETAGLGIARWGSRILGAVQHLGSEQRRKSTNADAARRQAEKLAPREVKVELAIDTHWLTAW